MGRGKFKDLTGMKFGKLTVIERAGHKGKFIAWRCKCDCGNEVIVRGASLGKNTFSCGCYKLEQMSKRMTENNSKHNLCGTRVYSIYKNMKSRCYNEKSPSYPWYGAKGIRVCEEWLADTTGAIAFYEWAISNGYDDNLTIDRIDNKGNYEPNNCRWITTKEQARNTSRNIYIEYKGETKCIAEWAEEYHMNPMLLYQRIINGKDMEWSLTTPSRKSP